MAKQQTYAIGPVVGTGRTKTEARADAERKAADWLGRLTDDGVRILAYGGEARVVVPLQDGTAVYSGNGSSSYSGECDTAKIVRREALHLAQLAWDGKTVDPPADLAWRFGRDETSDWFNWIAWQQSYKAWRDYGLNDQDARYYVGGLTHLLSEDGKRLVEKALQAA